MSKGVIVAIILTAAMACATICYTTYEHKATVRKAFELGYTKHQSTVHRDGWMKN